MSAVDVHAVVTGRADAPVVVLSNSLGSTHRMWDAQLADLEQRFRVVRYDTRGHGDSPVPDGPYSIDDLADDLVALLDRLGVAAGPPRRPVTGRNDGHAGGEPQPRTGGAHCAAVHRSAAATRQTPGSSGPRRFARRAARPWPPPSSSAGSPRPTSTRTPTYAVAHERMVASTPAEGYAGCCEAIAKLDLREELSAISAPTLAIAGADDPATPPAKLEEIAARIPGARLLVVPQAAHLANAEQPGIITPALIEHLEQQ